MEPCTLDALRLQTCCELLRQAVLKHCAAVCTGWLGTGGLGNTCAVCTLERCTGWSGNGGYGARNPGRDRQVLPSTLLLGPARSGKCGTAGCPGLGFVI